MRRDAAKIGLYETPPGGLQTSMIEDFDRRKEELLDRATMLEVADALGLEPAGKKDRHCPAHNDTGRPNLHLYDKEAHCFACGFHADAIGLVAKVKSCDFKASFDFLAGRFGLPLLADGAGDDGAKKGRGRGLGNGNRGEGAKTYPKPSPLPSTPSPTLATRSGELATATKAIHADQVVEPVAVVAAGEGSGLGYDVGVEGSSTYPKPVEATQIPPAEGDGNPLLPRDLWRDFETFADAWAYLEEGSKGYRRRLWRQGDRFVVGAEEPSRDFTPSELVALDPEVAALLGLLDDQVAAAGQQVEPAAVVASRRRSLRVEVFAALLDLATPSSATAAGEWLRKEKGIELATQDRFGLRFLDEWKVAAHELKDRFGMETLQSVGIYGKEKKGSPYFVFARHRLLFPFFWKGEPVDVQGRNVEADGKDDRFRNTTGANPIPYNAGALLEARATGSRIFICEGATDTLALAQSGRLVVGIVGTGGFKPAWLEAFEGLDVYLALDSDDAGRKAAKDITRVFVAAGHRAPKVVKLPEGIKDVNQFFRSMAQ